jgi:caffeoyl-CoA O-methyltransferase
MSEDMDDTTILNPAVARYLASQRGPRTGVLARLEAEAAKEGVPIVHPATAAFLEFLVLATSPERILEVGTAIGYSAILMGQHLPAWGTLDTIEVDPFAVVRARKNIDEAGLKGRVNVMPGPALKVIPTVENRYDLVFLDAAKEEYEGYLALALPLMPRGATIAVDNLLWSGRAATGDPGSDDPTDILTTRAIRAFNERFLAHPGLARAQIVAVGDGLGLAVRA